MIRLWLLLLYLVFFIGFLSFIYIYTLIFM